MFQVKEPIWVPPMDKAPYGIFDSIVDTIGNTPLVRLQKVTRGHKPTVLAKVEFFNPGGSVKDRIGVTIVEDYERRGLLKQGGTIVEATSGNTGVGLAIAAAVKGYKTVFVMPDKMSDEKIRLLRAFGARVVITPTAVAPEDPRSYYNVAKQIVEETPGAVLANQYHNMINPESHYFATGPEIWKGTDGRHHAFCGHAWHRWNHLRHRQVSEGAEPRHQSDRGGPHRLAPARVLLHGQPGGSVQLQGGGDWRGFCAGHHGF